MQHNSLFVSSFDITLELSIDSTTAFYEQLRAHSFWEEFIPNVSFKKYSPVAAQWQITEGDKCSFDTAKNYIQSNESYLKEIIVILESVFEQYRQEKSLYTFHGSAIAKDTHAIGFIGNLSGIGKSTMGTYAAQHGWEWIADEKFTIFENHVIGGTSGILNDAKTRSATSGQTPAFHSGTQYDLTLLCSPIVTSENAAVRHDWSNEKKLWIYNDEISRDIRQVNGVLSGFAESLQSFDNPQLTDQRNHAVALLASNVHGAFIRGNQDAILNTIENIITTE